MTKIRCLIFLMAGIFLTGCRSSVMPVTELSLQIDSIAHKWVPDKRENLLNYDIKMLSGNEILVSGETNLRGAKEEILMSLENSGLKYTDSLKVLPDPAEIDKPRGLVSVSVCNMKKNPSHSSELVSQAIMGTPVKILEKRGSWLLIQTPDYYIGWANGNGITEMNEGDLGDWQRSERLIYTAKSGDVIAGADGIEIISDIVAGSVLKSEGVVGNFFAVRLPDGRSGLIDKTEAMDFKQWCSEIRPEPGKMIRFAKSMTGYPYLWGGTSVKASDCSGFVKSVYFSGGIILARDASLQFMHGKPVDISASLDSLKAGDLVFFGYLNRNKEKEIIHVGMYIGDTEVIHCSGMVRINSLDSTRNNYSNYLGSTIMGARRIIGEASEKGIEEVARNSWYISRD